MLVNVGLALTGNDKYTCKKIILQDEIMGIYTAMRWIIIYTITNHQWNSWLHVGQEVFSHFKDFFIIQIQIDFRNFRKSLQWAQKAKYWDISHHWQWCFGWLRWQALRVEADTCHWYKCRLRLLPRCRQPKIKCRRPLGAKKNKKRLDLGWLIGLEAVCTETEWLIIIILKIYRIKSS